MTDSSTDERSQPIGCFHVGLFIAALIWIGSITTLGSLSAWFSSEYARASGNTLSGWVEWAIRIGMAVAIAIVAGVLFAVTRPGSLRAAYGTWLVAAAAMALLAIVHLVPYGSTQLASLVQIVIALALAALLWRWRAAPSAAAAVARHGWAAIAPWLVAPVLVLPWLLHGALGSPLDALLNLLAGASIGVLAGVLLQRFLFVPLGPALHIGYAGLVASVALLILGAGAGFGGIELLIMAALAPLGFGVAACARMLNPARSWQPTAVLVGVAVASALAFFDPTEMSILLGFDDIPKLASQAAQGALLAGLVVSAALWLTQRYIRPAPQTNASSWPQRLAAIAAWVVAGVLYLTVGTPGFYGDQLFVILRDQADLSSVTAGGSHAERQAAVYATLTQHATQAQAGVRGALNRFGIHYTPYYLMNALEVDGGPLVRLYLQSRPEVDRILRSPHLRPLREPPVGQPGPLSARPEPQWNITSIGADRVWKELGITGEHIVIGQADSGVDGSHPALMDGYRGRGGQDDYNWLDPWYGAPSPIDHGSHGTHTLGSVLGRGGIGVAPGAEWIACSNLARNLGNPARYLDCMQFLFAPYPRNGDAFQGDTARAAQVLNNSWGCPIEEGCDAESLKPAVDALRSAGVFVVVSAGNEGPGCSSLDTPLAIYDNVLSVGAIDSAGNMADFSSRGPVEVDGSERSKPEIVAPGLGVFSSTPGNTYAIESGTSMAGPHVAGVVALMWSANPRLIGDVATTEQLLLQTAKPYQGATELSCAGGDPAVSNVFGYGVVDAYAAVQAALHYK